jgi:hypothetical protein
LVFIELKAVYRIIRAGFEDNLTDYLNEHSIAPPSTMTPSTITPSSWWATATVPATDPSRAAPTGAKPAVIR